ncbi:MAG: asparagine synthase (glutamine-hydrolyzing) [Lachnospiraceae bacterium]|nr:asparagine synthase (glutamine-hydrolyzing) [Lachnospiraceae bacterium]
MCGICGFTGSLNNDYKTVLTNMMDKIIHRGPDSAGQYIDDGIYLGFRRLSIIDLDNGSQPMSNKDKDITVVFNGEIYNYKELRQELIEKGYAFQNNSDTETLINGYAEYGTDLVNHLRGMFAFVIWDKKNKTLFGARDHFGIKPFYYGLINDNLVFGSEIKSILEYPEYKKEVNLEALQAYLTFQYSVLPETFFKGIYKLMPGHYMVYKDGKLEITRYFEPTFEPEKGLTLDEWVNRIDKATKDSVDYHMISDVEVASLLSSGVDSSYLVARYSGTKTFTVGFENDGYAEIDYAKRLSKKLELENYDKTITSDEYWDVLPSVQYHMDEPLADASCIALYFVDREAAKQVKVVLSGEGADEFFGGYNIYHEPFSLRPFKKIPKPVKKIMRGIAKIGPNVKGKNFIIRGCTPLRERFVGNAFRFNEKEAASIMKLPKGMSKKYIQDITGSFYDKAEGAGYDDVTKMQYIDMNFWLIGDILLKADKMSMAHSLESRVPFLDKVLFETARRIPTEYKIHDKTTKYAFRECANKYLPKEVASKKKLGFPVPIAKWLRQDDCYGRIKEAFTSESADKFFNTDKLVAMLNKHKNGKQDMSKKIWTVYMFLIWYDIYFNNNYDNVKIKSE